MGSSCALHYKGWFMMTIVTPIYSNSNSNTVYNDTGTTHYSKHTPAADNFTWDTYLGT